MSKPLNNLYKTVIQVTVLSNGKFDLDDIHEAITDGDCSGTVEEISETILTENEMAVALLDQGSDPSFLLGEDWENWEDDPEKEKIINITNNDEKFYANDLT